MVQVARAELGDLAIGFSESARVRSWAERCKRFALGVLIGLESWIWRSVFRKAIAFAPGRGVETCSS